MADYLVRATPIAEKLAELERKHTEKAFEGIEPFGKGMSGSLVRARVESDGAAVWEERCYCDPPLKMERAEVLDAYFESIETTAIETGQGWERIGSLPRLFPDLPSE